MNLVECIKRFFRDSCCMHLKIKIYSTKNYRFVKTKRRFLSCDNILNIDLTLELREQPSEVVCFRHKVADVVLVVIMRSLHNDTNLL